MINYLRHRQLRQNHCFLPLNKKENSFVCMYKMPQDRGFCSLIRLPTDKKSIYTAQ